MAAGAAGDAVPVHEESSYGGELPRGVTYPVGNHAVVKFVYQWMKVGKVDVAVTLRADAMSALMLVMVTSVSLLVAIFAGGYMHGDPGYPRFFAAMALFVFSMCMLVLAGNFLLMFVFWEAVGLCSYLLIGYWYKKPSAAAAAKKAFVVNRIGDFGFILGVFMVWVTFGTLDFETLFGNPAFIPQVLNGIDPAIITTICILLFIGAIGKSAQFPLHVWLPDAMEGPTPVSALIHAATMVTAGVYLVARCAPLFVLSQTALGFVAIIGAITALLAAFTALTQYDLKRVLAYSTVSQLGFMFMSLGAAAADPVHLMQPAVTFAMFHMFTHAFFKAVLFLSAGSVMHSMGDVIDMRRFSGLKKVMPVTHWTFLAGAAALAGLPLLSGFWSKDEILAVIWDADRVPGYGLFFGAILAVALLASLMTAFYTFRAYFLTFHGPERFPEEAGHHPHEAPPAMAWPLRILGVAALLVGAIAGPTHLYAHYLHHTPGLPVSEPHGLNYVMMAVSSIIAIAGVGFAWMVYGKADRKAYNVQERYSPAYELSLQGLHLDAVYQALVVRPMQALSELSETLDRLFVDKLVDAVGYLPGIFGSLVRPIQNGFLQSYALVMLLGLVIFVFGVLRAIAGM
ncbi:MAG: NADH-quinone oxidoreductase subunit L [Planctomycetaceae bacterium]|nr:NADH-quinone oxidoreductase subunit L [Planctomycetaceae bacterium]